MGKNIGSGQYKYHGHTVEYNTAINVSWWQLHKTTGWISQCDTQHGSQKHRKYPLCDSTYTTPHNKHNQSMLLGLKRNVMLRDSGSEGRLSEGDSGETCNVQFLVHLDVGFLSAFSLWRFLELSVSFLHVFIFMLHFNNKSFKNRSNDPQLCTQVHPNQVRCLELCQTWGFFCLPNVAQAISPNSNCPHRHLCLQTHPFYSLTLSSQHHPQGTLLTSLVRTELLLLWAPESFMGFSDHNPKVLKALHSSARQMTGHQ